MEVCKKYKACLVVNEYAQHQGIGYSYFEAFSHVARMDLVDSYNCIASWTGGIPI
jgi:hypothetical protein